MRKTAHAFAFFDGVEILTTIENTYRPQLNGTRRRITRLGRTFFDAILLDDTTDGLHRTGTLFRGNIPSRASEVVSVSDTEATFRLGPPGSKLHTHQITYRKAA
jgi:hypothetical protein